MTDDLTPSNGSAEPRKFKLYRLDILCSNQTMRDDLEFMRLDEPGAFINILPTGEKNMQNVVRFKVQNKCFHELQVDGTLIEPGHKNIAAAIDYMLGKPPAPAAKTCSVPAVSGKPVRLKGLAFAKSQTATNQTSYRISPTVSGQAPLISDKYKVKRSDGNGEK